VDEIEVLLGDGGGRIARVALDHLHPVVARLGDRWGQEPQRSRPDGRPLPTRGGAAEVDHAHVPQIRETGREQLPTSSPSPTREGAGIFRARECIADPGREAHDATLWPPALAVTVTSWGRVELRGCSR